jgi:hypothetical protein
MVSRRPPSEPDWAPLTTQMGVDSEAELFKKLPTLEHMDAMLRATDDTVVITIRGIGE